MARQGVSERAAPGSSAAPGEEFPDFSGNVSEREEVPEVFPEGRTDSFEAWSSGEELRDARVSGEGLERFCSPASEEEGLSGLGDAVV